MIGMMLYKSIADSFETTFFREERWKMFLQGIGVTMLITVLSAVLGTLLGFGAYMLCRGGSKAANRITKLTVWLVEGMPTVVLLMILYYIVFWSLDESGIIVSVIAFTLVFGASVYDMLCMGVAAVAGGQLEAARALGYKDRDAFFRVVLPQALPHIIPVYLSEISNLLRATAVVGCIAVQDLTRIGDMILGKTFEAFLPLIAVAAVYYMLAAVLTAFVKRLTARCDWKSRDVHEILKGVDTRD